MKWARAGGVALIALLGLPAGRAGAQQTGRIVGRVTTAESGAPASEVQVFIPSSGLGTLTRLNGTFVILEVPVGPHEVRAERIGMAPVSQHITVAAGQAVEVNFQMRTQALGLDEIVVTGTAGASRRREVGNTISAINVTNLPSKTNQVTDILRSSAPGIEVTGMGGEMGTGSQIRLRGNKSVSMSNAPIIYIDGIRMQSKPFPNGRAAAAGSPGTGGNIQPSALNTVNPNDIERIEVIKGSAATTLYGTEASAGVIQIFTKRGASGAPVWNVEAQQTVYTLRKFGTDRFPHMRLDVFTRTGLMGDYTASVRGGGQTLQYFSSGSYEGGIGQFPQDTLSKWAARGNFTFSPTPQLQLQWNSAYTNQNQRNTPAGGNQSGVFHTANRGVANTFGSEDPAVTWQLFTQDIRQQIERFTSGGTATFSPLADLTNRLTIGYDYSQQEVRNLRPFGFVFFAQGSIFNDTWQNRILTFDYVGTYAFDVMKGLRSSFSWGGQTTGEDTRRLDGYGEGFPGAASPTVSSANLKVAEEDRSKIWNAGFFFQNVFDIQNRYFVTLGMRVDGNSAFGSGFGLQMYPKASASWVLSDERFWKEEWGSMKLRVAYGQSGRAPGAFDAARTWTSIPWTNSALVPSSLGNPDIGPEVTAELESGFDAEWFDGRLTSTLTYYRQKTSDALFNVAQIPTNGFKEPQRANVGKLSNNGLELSLEGSPIRRPNWELDLGLQMTTNSSKVLDLGGIPPFATGGGWIEEGHSAPVLRGAWVSNPDAIAAPKIEQGHIFGPTEPTRTFSPSTTIRLPGGVTLAARGEYRGGHYMTETFTSAAVPNGAWVPICWPYYLTPYDGPTEKFAPPRKDQTTALKPDTPALWRAICTSTTNQSSFNTRKADFFRLRSLSAQVPLGFALPDRIDNTALTLSLNNSYSWYNSDWTIGDPDMGTADGLVQSTGGRLATPITFNATLRMQF